LLTVFQVPLLTI